MRVGGSPGGCTDAPGAPAAARPRAAGCSTVTQGCQHLHKPQRRAKPRGEGKKQRDPQPQSCVVGWDPRPEPGLSRGSRGRDIGAVPKCGDIPDPIPSPSDPKNEESNLPQLKPRRKAAETPKASEQHTRQPCSIQHSLAAISSQRKTIFLKIFNQTQRGVGQGRLGAASPLLGRLCRATNTRLSSSHGPPDLAPGTSATQRYIWPKYPVISHLNAPK